MARSSGTSGRSERTSGRGCGSAERRRRVGVAAERDLAREALEQHDAQGEEIGSAVDVVTGDLFGREVLGRPQHRLVGGEVVAEGNRLGDAEVADHGAAFGGEQNVGGFDVAMDDAGAVRGAQRVGDLRADRRGVCAIGSRPLPSSTSRSVWPSTSGITIADTPSVFTVSNTGTIEGWWSRAAASASRRKRSTTNGSAASEALQDLDGDRPLQHEVGGLPHLGHSTPAIGRVSR